MTEEREPLDTITVRLPKSMHELLKRLAWERKISMNTLCVELLGTGTLAEQMAKPPRETDL